MATEKLDIFERYQKNGQPEVVPELIMTQEFRELCYCFYYFQIKTAQNIVVHHSDPSQPPPPTPPEIDQSQPVAQGQVWIQIKCKGEDNIPSIVVIPLQITFNPKGTPPASMINSLIKMLFKLINKGSYKFDGKDYYFQAALPDPNKPGELTSEERFPLMHEEFKSNMDTSGNLKPLDEDTRKGMLPQISAADFTTETYAKRSDYFAKKLQPIITHWFEYIKILAPLQFKHKRIFVKEVPYAYDSKIALLLAVFSKSITNLTADGVSYLAKPDPAQGRSMCQHNYPHAFLNCTLTQAHMAVNAFIDLMDEDDCFSEDDMKDFDFSTITKTKFGWTQSIEICADGPKNVMICSRVATGKHDMARCLHYFGLLDKYIKTGKCQELQIYINKDIDFKVTVEELVNKRVQLCLKAELHDIGEFSEQSQTRQSLAEFLAQSYNNNPLALKAIKVLADEMISSKQDVLAISPADWASLNVPIGAKNRAIKWAKQ